MPGGGADPDSKFTLSKRWGNCTEQLWEQLQGLAEGGDVDLGKALKDSREEAGLNATASLLEGASSLPCPGGKLCYRLLLNPTVLKPQAKTIPLTHSV